MKSYPRVYGEHSSHASAMRLLNRSGCTGGVLLDLGCGHSPLAEVATDAGFEYVGLDVDEHALADLAERGFEVHPFDLVAAGGAEQLRTIVDDRKLGAVLLLDVLEHLYDPAAMLGEVASLLGTLGATEAHLVVSIPNVTHVDLGAKLLAGRWDYLDTGLLDDTHIRFFDEWGYTRLLSSNGWREVDRDDVALDFSEQRFPADAPFVRPGAPLRELVHGLRLLAGPHALTYQFVRRFRLDRDLVAPEARTPDSSRRDLFASVLIDLAGDEGAVAGLQVLLGDLCRQTSGDFEVLVAAGADGGVDVGAAVEQLSGRCEQVVVVAGSTPAERLSAAVAVARGRYLCRIGPEVRVAPSWIERLAQAESGAPGSVLVAAAASLPGESGGEATAFFEDLAGLGAQPLRQDWIDVLSVHPPGDLVSQSFAIPTDALATMSIDVTDGRPGAIAVALLRAVELCGLAHCPEVCVGVPRSGVLDGAHQLSLARDELLGRPLILPPGGFSALLDLRSTLVGERAGRTAAESAARAAESTAVALAAQVERLDAELHAAHLEILAAERRGVVGRLVVLAKRALGRPL